MPRFFNLSSTSCKPVKVAIYITSYCEDSSSNHWMPLTRSEHLYPPRFCWVTISEGYHVRIVLDQFINFAACSARPINNCPFHKKQSFLLLKSAFAAKESDINFIPKFCDCFFHSGIDFIHDGISHVYRHFFISIVFQNIMAIAVKTH